MNKFSAILSVLAIVSVLALGGYFYINQQTTKNEINLLKSEVLNLNQEQPIANNLSPQPSTQSAIQSAQTKIALRNGTKTVGMTGKLETEIKKLNIEAEITSKENANVQTYNKTLVVVINNNSMAVAESLAKDLKVTISDLPAGEDKPSDSDILVIIGKDKV